MRISDLFVSVVAPVHNDADYIKTFVEDTIEQLKASFDNYEIVIVDDGSTDYSRVVLADILKEYGGIRVVHLTRYFGNDAATMAGLDTAIGDVIVTMKPGYDPPELIPKIVKEWRALSRDALIGVSQRKSPVRWFLYQYCKRFLSLKIFPGATSFRVLSRSAVNAITHSNARLNLQLISAAVGFNLGTFNYRAYQRLRSHILADVNLAISIVVTYSRFPLRLASVSCLLAVFGSLSVVADLVRQGQPELFELSLSGMSALLFLVLSVLTEYVGRLMEQSRGGVNYVTSGETNSSVAIQSSERRNVMQESE